MNTFRVGRLYEKKALSVLPSLNFRQVRWMNEEGESKLPYDIVAEKDGVSYFIEVRKNEVFGTLTDYWLFSKRKISRLLELKRVLLFLWKNDGQYVLRSLSELLRDGLIKIYEVNEQYMREYCKSWYLLHREAEREQRHQNYLANREKYLERARRYRNNNLERIKAYREQKQKDRSSYMKEWRRKNAERLKEYHRQYRESHKEERASYMKKWRRKKFSQNCKSLD